MNYPAYTNKEAVWKEVPVNSQALSLFRILFAALLIFDLVVYVLPHWEFLYGAGGAVMASERDSDLAWSILRYSDHPLYQTLIVAVYLTALLGFLVGYRTRLCAFVAFLGLKIIIDRNPAAISNAEGLECLLLLWSSFMPMDRYWSVAAASRGPAPRGTHWPLIPVIGLKGQILIIYFCSGMFKLGSEPWLSGQAITFALSDDFYGSALGKTLTSWLPAFILLLACWAITLLQVGFSALVYLPIKSYAARIFALTAAALMHTGFIFLMQIHLFPYLCLCYLILLFPDEWVNRLLAKRREKLSKIRIYYDPDCTFCRRTAFLLREFCLSPGTPVSPADEQRETLELLKEHHSWVVYGEDDTLYLKWRAVAYVMKKSPLLFPLGYLTDIPALRGVMEKLYHLIGSHRSRLGRISRPFLQEQPDRYLDRTQQWICLALITICFSYTIWALPQVKTPIPQELYTLARQTAVLQMWDIFAPDTVAYKRDFAVTAYDRKAGTIDLEPIIRKHFELRDDYYDFTSPRVLKFYAAMFPRHNSRLREGYVRYLCNQAEQAGTPVHRVKLRLNIQHNFIMDDRNRVDKFYNCGSLME